MKRNLVKEVPSASLVVKATIEKLGTRKRSLPEESVSGGDVGQAQPETTQSKWPRTSRAKDSTVVPCCPLDSSPSYLSINLGATFKPNSKCWRSSSKGKSWRSGASF
ncbi:unnamed protein product [Prunus brigantina]